MNLIKFKPSLLATLQAAFLIFGVLALGYSGFVLADAAIYQQLALKQFKHAVAGVPSVAGRSVDPALALARLEIPRLGIDAVVVEGTSDGDLRRALGHVPATALPGEAGNAAIAGHRDSFFRPLRMVRKGDLIRVTTRRGTYLYEVEYAEVVPPGDLLVLQPTTQPSLTLVTCFPFQYIGSAPDRFIVRARQTTVASGE